MEVPITRTVSLANSQSAFESRLPKEKHPPGTWTDEPNMEGVRTFERSTVASARDGFIRQGDSSRAQATNPSAAVMSPTSR